MCCAIPDQNGANPEPQPEAPEHPSAGDELVQSPGPAGKPTAGLDLDQLATVAGLIAGQLEATAFVARAGAERHRFHIVATAGPNDSEPRRTGESSFSLPLPGGHGREPFVVASSGSDDQPQTADLPHALPGHQRFLVVPIAGSDGDVSGLLGAGFAGDRRLSERDHDLLRRAAQLVTVERMAAVSPPPADRSRHLVDGNAESVRLIAAVSRVLVSGEAETISLQLDQVSAARNFEIRMEPDAIGEPVTIVRDRPATDRPPAAPVSEVDLLQTLIDLLPNLVFVKDTSSRFVRLNKAVVEAFGATDAQQVIGTTDFDWFPEPVARAFFDQEQALFATGEPIIDLLENQAVVNLLDRWRRTSKIPIRDRTGQVVGLVGSSWDVTESLAQERGLAQLAALVEWSSDAIIGIDTAGRIASWNPAAADLFGYTAEEAVGQEYTMLVPPGEPMISYDRLLESDRGRYLGSLETRRRRKDGSLVEVEVNASLMRDARGEPVGISTILREIGERKAAEARLRELEFRYRTYVEQMPALTYISTVGGEATSLNLVHLNKRIEEWSGYSIEEWERDHFFTFEIMHPDDRERVRAIDDETTLTGEPFRTEYRLIQKDGSVVWVRDEAVLIRDDEGEPLFWLGFILDITNLKQAEAEAIDALDSLRAANAELERVSGAKSEIVSMISHEFRTPLTSIQGFSELLVDEALSHAEVREFAITINSNAKRLSRMIGDMLDLDRLESGRMELRWVNVDLNEVVDDVVSTLRPTSSRHTFVTEVDPALPLIHGDLDLLILVVTNLVANAVKYSPAGGEITLTTTQTPDAVELTVADQGLGIPPDALETIFGRYSRIARPEQTHIEGTGLGLPIAREIASLHGGTIWAESTGHDGSVFHLLLPK